VALETEGTPRSALSRSRCGMARRWRAGASCCMPNKALAIRCSSLRYAPLVRRRGGFVILECQPPLLRLLANAGGIDHLITRGHLAGFRLHAPLLSLPAFFAPRWTRFRRLSAHHGRRGGSRALA